MKDKNAGGVHWSFWVIGGVALVWNIMGCFNFVVQMNPDMLASYRESERAIIEGRPVWATGGFAIAVFGGALGSILLLFKKYAAFYLFVASLLGVIVTTIRTLGVGGYPGRYTLGFHSQQARGAHRGSSDDEFGPECAPGLCLG